MLTRFCAKYHTKNQEKFRVIFHELIKFEYDEIRLCCCANFPINYYDFSKDESKRVRNLYECMKKDFYLWNNDSSLSRTEKMSLAIFMGKLNSYRFRLFDGKGLIGFCLKVIEKEGYFELHYHCEKQTLKTKKGFNSLGGKVKIFCDQEYFQLLIDCEKVLNGCTIADWDNSVDNFILSFSRVSLLYDLIINNKIEFIGIEPEFITKIRNSGMSRKLVNSNTRV